MPVKWAGSGRGCRPSRTRVADAVDPDLDLPSHYFRDGRRDLRAAMTTGSVISALASRPGMSSQPLGVGSRPTCEVLIRVMLLCMFPPPDEGIVPGNGSASQDHLSSPV